MLSADETERFKATDRCFAHYGEVGVVAGIAVVEVKTRERASALLEFVEHAAGVVGVKDHAILLGADGARDLHVAAHELVRLV